MRPRNIKIEFIHMVFDWKNEVPGHTQVSKYSFTRLYSSMCREDNSGIAPDRNDTMGCRRSCWSGGRRMKVEVPGII
jgi:hypothetical protein